MSARLQVQNLLDFIDASPSPWHAVHSVEAELARHRFERLNEAAKWLLQPEGRYYVVRDDSSIVLFVVGRKPLPEAGFKIIGAHTDSPGLRIKPNAANCSDSLARLNVEVYGGPILATFSDRDLSLAGRIAYRDEHGRIAAQLIRFDEVLLRLPNLAIHMNRTVNEDGLKFNKQTELPLILSVLAEQQLPLPYFQSLLEELSGIEAAHILSWDLNVYDTQKGAFWGAEQEFYTDSQLDNLASCHAGLQAVLDETVLNGTDATLVCAFFDHEEIGSESHIGAAGSFLKDMLRRIGLATETDGEDYARALARSFLVSADMAHAYQPIFRMPTIPITRSWSTKGP